MAALSVQAASLVGLTPSFGAAAAGGDSFANTGKEFLHVKNGHSGSQTVTVNSQTPCNYGSDHDVAVAVPAGGERIIGPFPKDRFNDANGLAQLTYSGVTLLTIAVVRVS